VLKNVVEGWESFAHPVNAHKPSTASDPDGSVHTVIIGCLRPRHHKWGLAARSTLAAVLRR
jgi:hypothetical protein